MNRYTGFSDVAQTDVELRIHFCNLFTQYNFASYKSKMLDNIYEGQLKKIKTIIKTLHEDLQYDYKRLLE